MLKSIRSFLLALLLAFSAHASWAQNAQPLPGTHTVASSYGFDTMAARLEQSIKANKMGLIAEASASRGAAARGVKIRGNLVLMVFRNDYAVRMLAASVPAGIEAPLRLYLTEDADGKTHVTWRAPSAVFAPFGSAELDAMARELDPVFEKIVRDAVGS
ncbi:MAG TPA: DUF302 domain-containing protein [Rhodocyclaceae bacterium]|nr:DUF302 domain-containing protein [Rhodocyclaceae bacterium]